MPRKKVSNPTLRGQFIEGDVQRLKIPGKRRLGVFNDSIPLVICAMPISIPPKRVPRGRYANGEKIPKELPF